MFIFFKKKNIDTYVVRLMLQPGNSLNVRRINVERKRLPRLEGEFSQNQYTLRKKC